MTKPIDHKLKRDNLVIRALTRKKNPLSFGEIEKQYGIAKSTAFDISKRYGIRSQFSRNQD